MAGENVTERIVRKVFAEALDLVVQLDRDDHPHAADGRLRRQVMEITAVTPTLSEDQTYEPIFVRDGLGRAAGVDGRAPTRPRATHRSSAARRFVVAGSARAAGRCVRHEDPRRARRRRVLRALLAGAIARDVAGASPPTLGVGPKAPNGRGSGCSRRVCRVTPQQFVAGSVAASAVALLVLTAHDRIDVRRARAGRGRRAACRARTSAAGARRACARCEAAWPDGLRDLLASISAGRSLTQAVGALAASGPPTAARRASPASPSSPACSAPGPRWRS